jgi:hypothetical protein
MPRIGTKYFMPRLINCLIQVATPLLIALSLLLFMAQPAGSTPLIWNLSNAVFDDGGQAYGSFIYDADTDTMATSISPPRLAAPFSLTNSMVIQCSALGPPIRT